MEPLFSDPPEQEGRYEIWWPSCDVRRLIEFTDRLEAQAGQRFNMAVVTPTTRFPLDGSTADAIVWLSVLFADLGWRHDPNTRTRVSWLPAASQFRLWGFEAVAAFFRIPQMRAMALLDRSSYAENDWDKPAAIIKAVRSFAVNEATAPHRRNRNTSSRGSRLWKTVGLRPTVAPPLSAVF
jgi:hypothetical protein